MLIIILPLSYIYFWYNYFINQILGDDRSIQHTLPLKCQYYSHKLFYRTDSLVTRTRKAQLKN